MADERILPGFEPLPSIVGPDGVVRIDRDLMPGLSPEQQDAIDAIMDATRYDPSRDIAGRPTDTGPQRPVGKGGAGEGMMFFRPAGRIEGLGTESPRIVLNDGSTLDYAPAGYAYDPRTGIMYEPTYQGPHLYRWPNRGDPSYRAMPEGGTFGGGSLPVAGPNAPRMGRMGIDPNVAGGVVGMLAEGALIDPFISAGRLAEESAHGLVRADSARFIDALSAGGLAMSLPAGAAGAGRRVPGAALTEAATPDVPPTRPVTPRPAAAVPEDAAVVIGTGGGSRPATPPPKRPLDPTGLYSHAQRSIDALPARGTGEQRLGDLIARGVKEAEIQATDLDRFLLGRQAADVRREMLEAQDTLARYQGQLKGAVEDAARRPGDVNLAQAITNLERSVTLQKQTLASRRRAFDDAMGVVRNERGQPIKRATQTNVALADVQKYIDKNRIRTTETVQVARRYPQHIEDAMDRLASVEGRDDFRGKLRYEGVPSYIAHALTQMLEGNMAAYARSPHSAKRLLDSVKGDIDLQSYTNQVERALSQGLGQSYSRVVQAVPLNPNARFARFSLATVDPANRSVKEIVQRIDSPQADQARAIIAQIPPDDRRVLLDAWGLDKDGLRKRGMHEPGITTVEALRGRYAPVIRRLQELERTGGVFVGGHFYDDPGSYGVAMTSMLRNEQGEPTLFLNQAQSDFTNAIENGRTTARHVLASSLVRWVDPVLSRVIIEAVESGAETIIIPRGALVNTYNPLPDSVQALYNNAYPSRMSALLNRIDKQAGRGTPVTSVTQADGSSIVRPNNEVIGMEFRLTPAIRERIRSGEGLRLMSGTDDPGTAAGIAAGTGIVRAGRGETRAIARGISRVSAVPERPTRPGSLAGRLGTETTTMEHWPRAYRTETIGPNTPHPGPVISYHGTTAPTDFTQFRSDLSRDIGHHFGTRDQAQFFTTFEGSRQRKSGAVPYMRNAQTARIIPAYLNIRNPIELPDLGGWRPERVIGSIHDRLSTHHRDLYTSHMQYRVADLDMDIRHHRYSTVEARVQIRSLLDDLGFDSIRYQNKVEGDGWSYIIWKPGLVRSTTNPAHLLYSRGVPAPTQRHEERDNGPAP